TTVTAPLQIESEFNDSIANANSLTLTTNGNATQGSMAGYISTSNDLDYFKLGTVSAGQSIVLSTRLPKSSGLNPVIAVYNSSGGYMVEANGGRSNDGVAQVDITTTDTYYVLVQAGNGTSGLLNQYILDAQIVLTSSIQTLPNLQVSSIALPTTSPVQS